jgi:DNA-binding transcriptional LysR family regulator
VPPGGTIESAQAPCDFARVFDWNDLRYLLAIARTGSLAGAARDLGVEHTTVGRRLAALEATLGARLFLRGPAGLSATPAGLEILPIAEEIATRVETIERRVSGADARVEGTVRLTTSETISGYFTKQFWALRYRHPELMIEILSGNRAYDLSRGEADLAVRVRETTEPDLITRKLGRAVWSLYAAPSYLERKGAPAAPEDLRGHDLISFDESLGAVPGALWLQEHGEGANIVMRGNSIVAVLNAAIFGMGLALLPCFMGDAEPALRRLTPRALGLRDVYLVVHPDLARVARVRAVMEFIVEVFERDAALWSGEQPL